MITTKVDISGMLNRLKRMDQKLDSLPWNNAAQIVLNSVQENFEVGGKYSKVNSPEGGSKRWVPRKDNESHKILKKSGKLQAANKMEVHKDGFAIGNKLEYQAVHNFGYPTKNIPARPFLVYQEEDMKKIKKSLVNHIKT